MKRIELIDLRLLLLLILGILFGTNAYAQPTTAAAYPFTAYTTTYSHVTGGTSVNIASDDVYKTNIPIGFNFTFCGSTYNKVAVSSNGWMSFGSPYSNWNYNYYYYCNYIGPGLMPLWDDLSGSGGSAQYKTTGTAPNRVFTFEWKNFKWVYYGQNCISFQVKLYEDGAIEFLYKQENGNMSAPSATIGICTDPYDYKVLNNSGASPNTSTSTFTTNINTRPATGQAYMWNQPPCQYDPVGVMATTIRSDKATIVWTNGNPPQGYEYVVDQNATDPLTGTGTSASSVTVTGLTPGTSYYAHVRAICSGHSYSDWVTTSFTTTMCVAPEVNMANITHNSATAVWSSIAIANNYEYALDTVKGEPTSGTATSHVTASSVQLTNLLPATHYYLYTRSHCDFGEISEWKLQEFTTMHPCLPPALTVKKLTDNVTMRADWPDVPTSVAYEYAVRSTETPPSAGITIYDNTVDVKIPNDNKPYYLHVRSKCVSIFNTSDWSTVTLKEPPATGIYNVNKDETTIFAYPNPVKDVVTIQLNSVAQESKIFVTDIAGKILNVVSPRTTTLELNLSAYAPGVYFIKYVYPNNNKTIKISKQ